MTFIVSENFMFGHEGSVFYTIMDLMVTNNDETLWEILEVNQLNYLIW